jgi:hypothetical protein
MFPHVFVAWYSQLGLQLMYNIHYKVLKFVTPWLPGCHHNFCVTTVNELPMVTTDHSGYSQRSKLVGSSCRYCCVEIFI